VKTPKPHLDDGFSIYPTRAFRSFARSELLVVLELGFAPGVGVGVGGGGGAPLVESDPPCGTGAMCAGLGSASINAAARQTLVTISLSFLMFSPLLLPQSCTAGLKVLSAIEQMLRLSLR
jgi:hypothetical protein